MLPLVIPEMAYCTICGKSVICMRFLVVVVPMPHLAITERVAA